MTYDQYIAFYRDIRLRKGEPPNNWLALCDLGLDKAYNAALKSYNDYRQPPKQPFLIRLAKVGYKYVR